MTGRSAQFDPSAACAETADPVWRARSRPGVRTIVITITAFLLIYGGLQWGSAARQSATFDEPLHLASGYMALKHGEHRVDPTHPPFLRMWAALPLLGVPGIKSDPAPIDRSTPQNWLLKCITYTQDFLFHDNDASTLLDRGRAMVIALGAFVGVLVFFWALEWLGFWPAVLALVFFLIEPNLAAHFTLVTTDGGVTLLYFGTVYFLWRTCRDYTVGNLAGLTACFALAMVSKFSAVMLGPVVVMLLLAAGTSASTITLRRAGAVIALLAVATFAAIWSVYGFRYAPSHDPAWIYRSRELVSVNAHFPLINAILNWVDAHHWLPNAYTQGFIVGFGTASPMPGYLSGEISTTGWWYYFPLALSIKTPAVLLAFAVLGLVFLARRRHQLATLNVIFLLLPPGIFFAVAMTSGINIGLRHVLPVYPFLILIAVVGVRELLALAWKPKWSVVVALTLVWTVLFARAYPNTLAFFNRLIGDPRRGWNYLSDSNLDWGQHLKLLKTWMDENRVEHVNLVYFGMSVPNYYGIHHTAMPGNWLSTPLTPPPTTPCHLAIGATMLSGVYLPQVWRDYYRGFKYEEPVAVLGNALAIYRIERWPGVTADPAGRFPALPPERLRAVAEGLYLQQRWPGAAIPYYEEYLKSRPGDSRSAIRLATALLDEKRKTDAVRWFEHVLQREPANWALYRQVAAQFLNHGELAEAAAYAEHSVRLRPESVRSRILLELIQGALAHPESAAPKSLEAAESSVTEAEPLGLTPSPR